MSQPLVTDYVRLFSSRISDLDKLIETPNIIKMQSLAILQKINKSSKLYASDRLTVEQGIQALTNINEGSIRENYKVIYAQLCVLATSVLEALLKQYFANAVSNVNNLNPNNNRLEKIKITASDLVSQRLRYTIEFPKLILEREKNEFQNLKKIKDVFRDYLSKDVELSSTDEKQIIFYLECRHVIVHKGSIVDEDFLRNVTSYTDANLKKYRTGDHIQLDDSDWQNIKNCYGKLVDTLTKRNAS